MKIAAVLSVCCFLYVSLPACPTDMSSAGVVMNDGEYSAFERIESFGLEGVNYLKENIPLPGQATVIDSTMEGGIAMGKTKRMASPLSATLVSESFKFDPNADSPFVPEPAFAFSNDTLIVHDYWALVDQPAFRCSLSVATDTLHVSYLPVIGPVNDWTPSVETVLKIKFRTYRRTIVCCFDAVKNHARAPRPEEAGFGDAGNNRYAAVPVPPLSSYKYRAHSCPSAMVFLNYERIGLYRLTSPRITVTYDSAVLSNAWTSLPSLSHILSEELQWLAGKGICTPSPSTITRLASLAESDTSGGGLCYWTRQDSLIALNQWFEISQEGVYGVYSTRSPLGGCGLGTDFSLPPASLGTTGTGSPHAVSSVSPRYAVTIKANGKIAISSLMSFDKVAVYNLLGREVFSVKLSAPMNDASVPLVTNGLLPGNYLVVVSSANRRVDCRPLFFR